MYLPAIALANNMIILTSHGYALVLHFFGVGKVGDS
jgi:hypothetical protein